MVRKIKLPDGFEVSENQDNDFESAIFMLRKYCGGCERSKECRINYGLRCAMGENYPFGHPALIHINKKGDLFDLFDAFGMICTEYKDRQMVFPFAEKDRRDYWEPLLAHQSIFS